MRIPGGCSSLAKRSWAAAAAQLLPGDVARATPDAEVNGRRKGKGPPRAIQAAPLVKPL